MEINLKERQKFLSSRLISIATKNLGVTWLGPKAFLGRRKQQTAETMTEKKLLEMLKVSTYSKNM